MHLYRVGLGCLDWWGGGFSEPIQKTAHHRVQVRVFAYPIIPIPFKPEAFNKSFYLSVSVAMWSPRLPALTVGAIPATVLGRNFALLPVVGDGFTGIGLHFLPKEQVHVNSKRFQGCTAF